jgi:hypothetical protein
MKTALGLSVHTGWAAGVVLSPQGKVAGRFRLDLGRDTEPMFVYHIAETAKNPAAVVQRMRALAIASARSSFDAIAAELAIDVCGIVTSNAKIPSSVEAILASHAAMHAAEGELFRAVLEEIATERGIAVRRVASKQLNAEAQRVLGLDDEGVAAWLKALGKGLGSPWAKDQRDAALVARVVAG